MTNDEVRIIQYGLGTIGSAIARHVLERPGLNIVGAVDIDPEKSNKDLGTVLGLNQKIGVEVVESVSEVVTEVQADVVLHAAASYFSVFKSQIIDFLHAGLNVISTAEELSFPWLAHPDGSYDIDKIAKKVGRTVLATGVNPGFIMDSLCLYLTSICQKVDRIVVVREINASVRRKSFQEKIGAGLSVEGFNSGITEKKLGHVGLQESIEMIVDTLGEEMVEYESKVSPILTDKQVETEHFSVRPGQVVGLEQNAIASTKIGEFVNLTFKAALDSVDEKDVIRIEGEPNLEVRLKGTNGDLATVAIVVNAIPQVIDADPGLVTMRDIPLVTYWH